MIDRIGACHGEGDTPGTNEALAALLRQMMAECRARLAAEDAAREAVPDGQEAERGVVERPAASPAVRGFSPSETRQIGPGALPDSPLR